MPSPEALLGLVDVDGSSRDRIGNLDSIKLKIVNRALALSSTIITHGSTELQSLKERLLRDSKVSKTVKSYMNNQIDYELAVKQVSERIAEIVKPKPKKSFTNNITDEIGKDIESEVQSKADELFFTPLEHERDKLISQLTRDKNLFKDNLSGIIGSTSTTIKSAAANLSTPLYLLSLDLVGILPATRLYVLPILESQPASIAAKILIGSAINDASNSLLGPVTSKALAIAQGASLGATSFGAQGAAIGGVAGLLGVF